MGPWVEIKKPSAIKTIISESGKNTTQEARVRRYEETVLSSSTFYSASDSDSGLTVVKTPSFLEKFICTIQRLQCQCLND